MNPVEGGQVDELFLAPGGADLVPLLLGELGFEPAGMVAARDRGATQPAAKAVDLPWTKAHGRFAGRRRCRG